MKFSLVALLAAASSVVAQTPGFDVLTVPAQDQVLKTGSSFAIQWEPNKVQGTVSITLIQGAAFNLLQRGPVIASGIDNLLGTFDWNPVPAADFKAYGLNISLDSDPSTYQLSNGFYIAGDESTSTTSKAHTTSTVTLAPGPSYSALVNTTTSVWSTSYKITPVASANTTTFVKPTATGYPTTVAAATTTPAGSAPTQSATTSPVTGAAAHVATSGLAMIGGLLLAFAL